LGPSLLAKTKNSKVGASETKLTNEPESTVLFSIWTQVSELLIQATLESPFSECPVKYGTLPYKFVIASQLWG
jgi:hypothetical protein